MFQYSVCFFFFFNDTATTEIYTLSLHDALPISAKARPSANLALTAWLQSHHLGSGIAGYWQANSVVFDSGAKITMRPVKARGNGKTLVPNPWELDTRLLDPRTNYANFLVTTAPGTSPGRTMTEVAITTFGKPAHVYRYQGYSILVW